MPDVVAKRAPPKGRLKAFAIEPEVTINNQWSSRYTVVEVTGLDRPGLLYELTTTLSKLNLNIASAHVATFGERVVDVFYVTDLLGAQITTADPPVRDQAAAASRCSRRRLRNRSRPRRPRRGESPLIPPAEPALGPRSLTCLYSNRPLNRPLYRDLGAFSALGTGYGVAAGK